VEAVLKQSIYNFYYYLIRFFRRLDWLRIVYYGNKSRVSDSLFCLQNLLQAREAVSMKVYYCAEYCAASHAWDTTRKADLVAQKLRGQAGIEITGPQPLTRTQLLRAHSEEYVEAVMTGSPRHLAESNGFDWCPNLPTAVLYSNGGVVAAAYQAIVDGASGSLSSGLHHAGKNRGGGFCTFNGLAIAALDVIATGAARKVLIVDYDAHYGDGTAEIIRSHDCITQIDVSSHFRGSGYLDECRRPLATLKPGDFDLMLYNAGMDVHEKCRIGGRSGVTDQTLNDRDALVFQICRELALPVAFVLAGGYANKDFPEDQLAQLHATTALLASKNIPFPKN
jgi:acetoin utilization deacetylase AcuC-like enzyme